MCISMPDTSAETVGSAYLKEMYCRFDVKEVEKSQLIIGVSSKTHYSQK